MSLRLGTRGSVLAQTQARLVAERLGSDVEIVVVRTREAEAPDRPIRELGESVFVSRLEEALRRGAIDVAVHSLKDLPTGERDGLVVAAVPLREDPRDVLYTRERMGLASLRPRALVGTGSPRRAAFLRALRPDVETREIRGNVDTRLRKVLAGEYDGTLLALAGLRRLGVSVSDAEVLDLDAMPPAPGQGALAAQCRADDRATIARLAAVDDADAHRATDAERALLHALGASCEIPLGAFARIQHGEIVLEAALAEAEKEAAGPRRCGMAAHLLGGALPPGGPSVERVRRVRVRGRDATEVAGEAAAVLRAYVHA